MTQIGQVEPAGTIAGAAVWVSFLVGGIIALLQGYSFSKLGARYPSAGGIIESPLTMGHAGWFQDWTL
jgi:amino acid transporter